MIPSLRLVLVAVLPVILGLAAVVEDALVGPMLAVDGLVVLVAVVDAWLGRERLVSALREAPRVLSLGRDQSVALALHSRARRALAVEVADDLPDGMVATGLPVTVTLGAGRAASATYRVRAGRRGAFQLGSLTLRYPTPLGLWRRQTRIPAAAPIRVYPDLLAVRTFELLARQQRESAMARAARLRGGENEFERLRDFQPDDEFRSIDWKATARQRRLIAREYQLERNQTLFCLLDAGRLMTAETRGLTLFDHALNATLMAAHVAARTGDQVGLCVYGDRVRSFLAPVGGTRAVQRIVHASYDLHPALVEPDLGAAVEMLAVRLRRRALVTLFTQIGDDVSAAALRRLVQTLTPRHLPLVVLLRDVDLDALLEGPPGNGAADLYDRAAAAELVSTRERLARDLERGGALVLHVAPHKLTPALISRYLEVKARALL